jgi:PKD repeat protein
MRNAIVILSCLVLPSVALAQNTPPVVEAGPDQTVIVNSAAFLQGTATDPDGDPIVAWLWAVDSAPIGSSPAIEWPDQPDPQFFADVAGDYVLSLIASDGTSWSDPDFVTIHVRELMPPQAVIIVSATSGQAPLTVVFDGSTSFVDPFAAPLTYDWNFGDFSSPAPGAMTTHTYTAPGIYDVTLTVVDALGQADLAFVDITVVAPNNPPVISPSATPNAGDAPLTVQFHANAVDPDGDTLTYLWDFGDPSSLDNTSTLADPGHVYEAPGAYTAWLTVSDGQHEVTGSVTVVVEAGGSFSVRSATVLLRGPQADRGAVTVWADLDAPLPSADELVQVWFDGIELFAEPFGGFRSGYQAGAYSLARGRLVVRLDFEGHSLYVAEGDLDLAALDPADGVDVQVRLGDWTRTEAIPLAPVGNRLLRYTR